MSIAAVDIPHRGMSAVVLTLLTYSPRSDIISMLLGDTPYIDF